jgi:hypothetical protein
MQNVAASGMQNVMDGQRLENRQNRRSSELESVLAPDFSSPFANPGKVMA